ncbi:MAG TPA: type II CAAX endopeptidase family protein [Verrucomicrobiales bacterium]|jgi:membrane protease YdiL (CAAX protease family)|nr:type II CAAX endopeptidase family protein [Verrucomicrobiales bacterium]
MPSEHAILLSTLIVVFVSLPIAMLIRSFFPQPDRRVEEERAAVRMAAEAVPAQVLVPPPLPPSWMTPAGPVVSPDPWAPPQSNLDLPLTPSPQVQKEWTKTDAWFAFFLAVIVSLLLFPVGGDLKDTPGGKGENFQLSSTLFIISLAMQAIFVGLVVAWLRVHRKFNVTALFGLKQMSLPKAAVTALKWIVPAFFALSVLAYYTVPLLQQWTGLELKRQILVESAPQVTDVLGCTLMFAALCIGAPVMEELIFRGMLFSVAAKFIHPIYANVATSLLFGVIHNNLLAFIPLTFLGMLFAWVYQRTRCLTVPILMHSMFNGLQFLILLYGPKDLQ